LFLGVNLTEDLAEYIGLFYHLYYYGTKANETGILFGEEKTKRSMGKDIIVIKDQVAICDHLSISIKFVKCYSIMNLGKMRIFYCLFSLSKNASSACGF